MRNCFVPDCDLQHRHLEKRMMFLPPKDPEMFSKWQAVMKGKREFKRTDRICERHFHKEHIETHWDHIINGKVHKLERGKPRLLPEAIPSLFLSSTWPNKKDKRGHQQRKKCKSSEDDEFNAITTAGELVSESNLDETETMEIERLDTSETDMLGHELNPLAEPKCIRINSSDSEIDSAVVRARSEAIQVFSRLDTNNSVLKLKPLKRLVKKRNITAAGPMQIRADSSETAEPSIIQIETKVDESAESPNESESEDETVYSQRQIVFDTLHDDVFEVQLPCTSYGIHRDPERTFIAFSRFCPVTMATSRALFINNRLRIKFLVDGRTCLTQKHRQLTVEDIEKMLQDLESFEVKVATSRTMNSQSAKML